MESVEGVIFGTGAEDKNSLDLGLYRDSHHVVDSARRPTRTSPIAGTVTQSNQVIRLTGDVRDKSAQRYMRPEAHRQDSVALARAVRAGY